MCNHFEDRVSDNPVEEEYFSEYNEIAGASQEEMTALNLHIPRITTICNHSVSEHKKSDRFTLPLFILLNFPLLYMSI